MRRVRRGGVLYSSRKNVCVGGGGQLLCSIVSIAPHTLSNVQYNMTIQYDRVAVVRDCIILGTWDNDQQMQVRPYWVVYSMYVI